MDWIDVAQERDQWIGFCGHGNEHSISIKFWEILAQLATSQERLNSIKFDSYHAFVMAWNLSGGEIDYLSLFLCCYSCYYYHCCCCFCHGLRSLTFSDSTFFLRQYSETVAGLLALGSRLNFLTL
jgi:hypothetical protein